MSPLPPSNFPPCSFGLGTFRDCFFVLHTLLLGKCLSLSRSCMWTLSNNYADTLSMQFCMALVLMSAAAYQCSSTDLTISLLHSRITLDLSLHVFISHFFPHGKGWWGWASGNVAWCREDGGEARVEECERRQWDKTWELIASSEPGTYEKCPLSKGSYGQGKENQ